MLLTKEQIDLMDTTACELALKKLAKTYPLEDPLNKLTKEHWEQFDDIVNTLLWLEDRISIIAKDERMENLNNARWNKIAP